MATSNEDRIRLANDELLGKGNLSVVTEFFATTYVVHANGEHYNGHQFIKKFAKLLRSAIPDVQVVDVAVLSNARGLITWQRTLAGTHKANMMGIPPSGKRVEWRDMVVTRFEGEMIAEEWTVSDLAGQLLIALAPA